MNLLRKNLLKKALKRIPLEQFQYLKFLRHSINDLGLDIPEYDEPITVYGSVQPPELSLYQQMGLSLEKNYRYFYCSIDIRGNETEPQPDRFIYGGKTFEVVKNSPWFNYDGWCGVLGVELKNNV